jgi:hypothetical protein
MLTWLTLRIENNKKEFTVIGLREFKTSDVNIKSVPSNLNSRWPPNHHSGHIVDRLL